MMELSQAHEHYKAVRRRAKRYAAEHADDAFGGLLPALDGVAPFCAELNGVPLGVVDVPTAKIRGTAAAGRASAFAGNYLPLLPPSSEFAQKWASLYCSHVDEGIRDPGTAYEYLGYCYVIEGNKRVSVLRSLDAPSVQLDVTRLIPRESDAQTDPEVRLYLEWLNAAPRRKLMNLWLTRPGGHTELCALGEETARAHPDYPENWMEDAYDGFRALYHKIGYGKLPLTTGDAYLTYVRLYGFPYDCEDILVNENLLALERQFLYQAYGAEARGQARAIKPKARHVIFVYDHSPETDAWDAAHDYGRRVLSAVFPEAKINALEGLSGVPDADAALRALPVYAEPGDAVVFVTGRERRAEAQRLLLAGSRAQAQTQTLVCHCHPQGDDHVTPTYYGRTAEPLFVLGALAGSLSGGRAILCRTGTSPLTSGEGSAFALGASLADSRARVDRDTDSGGHDLALVTGMFECGGVWEGLFPGVYARLVRLSPDDGRVTGWLAAAAWNFGAFYCALCASLWAEDDTGGILKSESPGVTPLHFESGLDSGLLNVYLNYAELPHTARLLAEAMIGYVKRGGVPMINTE